MNNPKSTTPIIRKTKVFATTTATEQQPNLKSTTPIIRYCNKTFKKIFKKDI